MKTGVTRACLNCGTDFYIKKNVSEKRGMGKYCSRSCFLIKHSVKINKNCSICHEDYLISPNRKAVAKYCSRKCSNLARIGCKVSKETIEKRSKALMGHPVSDEVRRGMSLRMKGCTPWNKGKKCPSLSGKNHWNWQGGRTQGVKKRVNDSAWIRLAKSIYKRDNWSCQRCHKHIHSNPQCHHKVPWKITKNNNPDNLITLCASCHIYVERHLFDFLRIPSYDLI